MNETIATKLELCVARFDFDRVACVLNMIDWTDEDGKPPTEDVLTNVARRLLEEAWHDPDKYQSGGGFRARWCDCDGNWNCYLEFLLDESTSRLD